MTRPKVFVASSVEGLNIAYPIQTNLQHDADLTVWSQGVFTLSDCPIDSLCDIVKTSDFGIFVFSSDDVIKMRGAQKDTIRDNVLFELGLFMGRLGKKRCFIVMPDNEDLHIPSDLYGITTAKYSGKRDIEEIDAALGPCCHQIRKVIQKHGLFSEVSEHNIKIPVSVMDGYDENDKIALLKSWLTIDNASKAIKYIDIDNLLGLEIGTTKRLIPNIILLTNGYSMDTMGSNVFSYKYSMSFVSFG